MVKMLDEIVYPPLIGHIGWSLWQASEMWMSCFTAAMVERGHPWFAEARGALFRFVGPKGISQSELAHRARVSKQAVQQLLDQLEADGIVERIADPLDQRAKRIVLTKAGLRAAHDANDAKRQVEEAFRRKLGRDALGELKSLLDRLVEAKAAGKI